MKENKPTKIVWMAWRPALPAQVRELKRLFGENITIIRDLYPFSSVQNIKARYEGVDVEELIVVAPLSMIAQLCRLGIKPLWAEMEAIPAEGERNPDCEVDASGRRYRFKRFRRVVGIKIRKVVTLDTDEGELMRPDAAID